MKKKRRKRRKHIGCLGICFLFLLTVIFAGVCVLPLVKNPENFREVKTVLSSIFRQGFQSVSYDAKALLLTDRSNGEVFLSKREAEPELPASLAKLFVVEYAAEIAAPDAIVFASQEAISMTKQGSSVAWIQEREYFLRNLFAAMLVPSGNDAAYVVADYCGGILSPQSGTTQERIQVFMNCLNTHLQEKGYKDTVLYDPSGFDQEAVTTASDLAAVTERLLEYQWFRDMVSQNVYTATLPDGSTVGWQNTNEFLNPSSEYYNENVLGIKTGSMSDNYSLIVLYQQHGKEFLICSLGSKSDASRYEDVIHILKTIDESDYLSR